MLDPDYLETAGDLVAGVYSDIEAEMCDALVIAMLDGDIGVWQARIALANLSQGEATQLRAILEGYRGEINDAVRKEVEEALKRSDSNDLAVVKKALGIELPKISTQQIALAVQTIGEMLERDNIAMLDGARNAFYRETSRALVEVGAGWTSIDEAMLNASRRLAHDGIDCIQYRDPTTGEKTVSNHVDVAVRRHVRSQLQQACAERTMEICEHTGCEFVEVSSHYGARPSHQEWEGRVYSLKGRVTVDGVTYEDFGEGTGYYGTGKYAALGDRLCGVNCRHHWGPWFPGMPHAYQPKPKHPSGKSNEEIYKLTQKQRALERELRATKRELSAAEAVYDTYPSLKNQTEVNKLRKRLKKQNDRMKKLVADNRDVLKRQPNRERAGDMPRNTAPRASGRTIDHYVALPKVTERIEEAGISKTDAKESLQRVASDMGIGRGFSELSARDQDRVARVAILPKLATSNRTITVGGTFGSEPSSLFVENMETRLVPETIIKETVIFAGNGTSKELRCRNRLCELYGGDPWMWSHAAGVGWVFFPVNGKIIKAELHWVEEPTVGIRELKIKEWLEDYEG